MGGTLLIPSCLFVTFCHMFSTSFSIIYEWANPMPKCTGLLKPVTKFSYTFTYG